MANRAPKLLKASDAARALGISLDTLRRWDRSGRIRCGRDDSGRRVVAQSEIDRLKGGPPPVRTGTRLSARNRIAGVVRQIKADAVMALVEIEAGSYVLAAAPTAAGAPEVRPPSRAGRRANLHAPSALVSPEGGSRWAQKILS